MWAVVTSMPKKKQFLLILYNFLLFALVLLIHYSAGIDLSIKNAVPFAVLPLLTAFAVFSSPTVSAVTGLVVGIFMDSAANESLCFNAIFLMLAAVFVTVVSNNLFNKNIRSALLLSVIVSLVFYLLRWGIFYAFGMGVKDNLDYLLKFVFPSVIYTNIFIFPFFYIQKFLGKLKSK